MSAKKKSPAKAKMKARRRRARSSGQDVLSFPDTKISEAFLNFAEPLFEIAPADATEADMQKPLQLAFTVWNAVVYADAVGNTDFLDGIRKLTAHEPVLAAFVEQLIQRKRDSFGDDHRVVGEYKLYRKDGEIRLRAEARDPRPAN